MVFFAAARPTPSSLWLGACVVLAGLAVRAWAAGTLDKDWRLTVAGPYAYTRNPLYLGSLIIGLGASAASGRPWPWLAVVFLIFFAWTYGPAMTSEAGRLEREFGQEYSRYGRRVPLLVPRRRPYRVAAADDADPSFSLGRYGRNKEYEALLGAVAGFALLLLKAGWQSGWLG